MLNENTGDSHVMLKLINILSNINPLLLLQTYHYLRISHLQDSFVIIIKGEIVGNIHMEY